MGARPKNANAREPNAQSALPSEINSQPWWRGPGFGAIAPPLLAESVSKAGSIANLDGGDGLQGVSQSQQEDKGDGNVDGSKQMQNSGIQADGNYGPEHQHQQPATTVTPNVMAEFHVPHTQLELGQSIACAGYTYADLYGLMTAYGNPALVHPQLIGMPQTRMPLPLEMAEEPVYVNAKQYHGILRRRQSRAKAELENKLVKVRKPYLHESRHQHAMRRARGCGGRFLNTKKNEGDARDANPKNTVKSGTSFSESSHSEIMPTACPGNELSASTAHALEGDCSGQQRNGILVNRPSTRAVAI